MMINLKGLTGKFIVAIPIAFWCRDDPLLNLHHLSSVQQATSTIHAIHATNRSIISVILTYPQSREANGLIVCCQTNPKLKPKPFNISSEF